MEYTRKKKSSRNMTYLPKHAKRWGHPGLLFTFISVRNTYIPTSDIGALLFIDTVDTISPR